MLKYNMEGLIGGELLSFFATNHSLLGMTVQAVND